MRTLSLLLALAASAIAQPSVKPRVVLGTSALLARDSVLGVCFSPDSRRVGIIERSGLRYWDLATAEPAADVGLQIAGGMQRVVMAADGRSLLGLSYDGDKGNLVLYVDQATAPELLPLKGHRDDIFFSESGRHATAMTAESFRVFDTTDGTTLAEFNDIDSPRRFSASADGRVIAVCNRDGEVTVRSANGPAWSPQLAKDHFYSTVALSPDGHLVATASFIEHEGGRKVAGPIEVRALTSLAKVRIFTPCEWFAEFPNRLRFTPDGRTLLAGDGAYLRGWDVESGQLTFAVEPGWNYPGGIVVSPDSRSVALAYAKRAMIWNLRTGQAPRGFEGHTGPAWSLTCSPDGAWVAATSYGLSQVLVYHAASGRLAAEIRAAFPLNRKLTTLTLEHPDAKPATIVPGRIRVEFSRDGRQIATVNEATGAAGPVRLWDTATGRQLWQIPIEDVFAPDVAFTPHGLFVAHSKPTLYDLATGQPQWASEAKLLPVGLVVSRRGDRAVVEIKGGSKHPVFDTATGKVLQTVDGVPHAFSPDGRTLRAIKMGPNMTGGTFNDLIVQTRLEDQKEFPLGKAPMGHAFGMLSPDGELRQIVFSRDGGPNWQRGFEFREVAGDRLISTAMRVEGVVAAEPWEAAFFQEHHPGATAFSNDNRLFAAVYSNGRLGVWDVVTGLAVLKVDTGCGVPKFVAFSPDGGTVFTSLGDGAGGPIYGFDTTGLGEAADLRGRPAAARHAVESLAADRVKALATATVVLAPATAVQLRQCETWLENLSAPSFREREAASAGLRDLGWRVEDRLRQTLATTRSEEARERLAAILAEPDVRPHRIVQLLERIGARRELETIAAVTPPTAVSREARRALERLP